MSLKCGVFGLLLALAPVLIAAAPSDAQTGICTQSCDHKLADCQKKNGRRCAREHQFCHDGCLEDPAQAAAKSQLTRKQRALVLCRQRCEISASECRQASPGGEGSCNAGKDQCLKRCGK